VPRAAPARPRTLSGHTETPSRAGIAASSGREKAKSSFRLYCSTGDAVRAKDRLRVCTNSASFGVVGAPGQAT